MAEPDFITAIMDRAAKSKRPLTRAEAATVTPAILKRKKQQEKAAPKPLTRAEAANIARTGAEKFNELREMSANPPAPARTRAEATTYMKNRQMAPATSTPESPVPSARTTPYQRATADVKAGDVKIEGLGYQKNAPEMSEADSTGYAKLESSMFPKGVEVAAPTTAAPAAMPAPEEVPPKAVPVIDEARMASLFRKTTGTEFNPQSKADRGRMDQLVSFIEQDPERLNKSDTKIALDFYRTL